MADLPAPARHRALALGWCLALYPRLSQRARRRMAALLVAAALASQPLAGGARAEHANGGAGGNFRSPVAVHAPAPRPGGPGAGNPDANPAVARALAALGLDGPAAPAAPGMVDHTPDGSEFQVNTYTTGIQNTPSVAMDADGDFVVVWHSLGSGGTDTDGFSIQGQRFNAAGTPQGSEFQINTYTTRFQTTPSVAMGADGDFVVVWQSLGSSGTDTSGRSIQGQRFNAAGAPQGGEFQVNTYTTNDQTHPSVAMDADGDFVVTWQSFGSGGTDTDDLSIQGQRFNAAGTPQGSQFQVNTFAARDQRFPSAAMDADGDFIVVWDSGGSSGTDSDGHSIQGQRYNPAGTAVGGEFQVNAYTTMSQGLPSVAMDADGDFVVVWMSNGSGGTDADSYSIQGQRFSAAGSAMGSQFQVNAYTTGDQQGPTAAMDADGDFVVVWSSYGSGGTDTSGASSHGQVFSAGGAVTGSEFQVNTTTTGNQFIPKVAMDVDGDFVAAWASYSSGGTDASAYSIQGQRYLSANAPTPTPTDTPVPTPTPTSTPTETPVPTDTPAVAPTDTPTPTPSPPPTSTPTPTPPASPTSTPTPTNPLRTPTATPTGLPMPTPTATSTWIPDPSSTVDLRYFRAIGLPDRAILLWETTREERTLGFEVLRSAGPGEPWLPVNAEPIRAAGAGHVYVLHDAPGPGTWRYRLVDLGQGGTRGEHPAIEVEVGPGATGSEVFLPSAMAGPNTRW